MLPPTQQCGSSDPLYYERWPRSRVRVPRWRGHSQRSTPSPETVLDVGRLLLNYVLSDLYVDVALVGMRAPRFVELNNDISDDVASRIDMAALHDRYVR